MSRPLYRGATPERVRVPKQSSEEPGSPTEESHRRGRPVWETCFPHSVRLWILNLSFSAGSHKHGLISSSSDQAGFRAVKLGDSPGGHLLSLNSSSGASSGFGPDCCCECLTSSPSRSKPGAFSLLPLFLICLIGAVAFVGVTRSNRPIPRVVFPPYNPQRAHLLAWKDVLRGGILGTGSLVSNPREVGTCRNGTEDYIPCYNITSNLEAGYSSGREYERHCELSGAMQCLVPAPKDYQIVPRWPNCSERIWRRNLKISDVTAEQKFIVEEKFLMFPEIDQHLKTRVESHVQRIAGLLGFSSSADFVPKARVRTVLDIGCGVGSLGAYLWDQDLVTMCVGPYKKNGGPIQIALERGFPAMVVSLGATQLPFPTSSFDFIHCAGCGLEMRKFGALSVLEVDRLLRVGGYFVWFIPAEGGVAIGWEKTWRKMQNLTSTLAWEIVSPPQNNANMVIWQKMSPQVDKRGGNGRHQPLYCDKKGNDGDWAWNQPLKRCITLPPAHRQMSVQEQLVWPARLQLVDTESAISGPQHDEATGEPKTWTGTVSDYWSLLTPIIFSDHPKRLVDEEVGPNSNVVRNVMDMNAGHGALNAALTMSGKQVWVMNVIPASAPNTLPFIFDRGLIGAAHDWCDPFPTYPRTYDLLHAVDLLSQEVKRRPSCGLANLFLEMDRMLRPEGWVFLRDDVTYIEDARAVANQMRWESRLVEIVGNKDQRLLVCQKTFWKV